MHSHCLLNRQGFTLHKCLWFLCFFLVAQSPMMPIHNPHPLAHPLPPPFLYSGLYTGLYCLVEPETLPSARPTATNPHLWSSRTISRGLDDVLRPLATLLKQPWGPLLRLWSCRLMARYIQTQTHDLHGDGSLLWQQRLFPHPTALPYISTLPF